MAKILVLNGPNLNLLGEREPHIYGTDSLDDINGRLSKMCKEHGHQLKTLQSNAEHVLIERLHAARKDATAFILINPGGFSHTSIALRDAILATELPFIEVHLSNLHRREEYRRKSYFSDIAIGTIVGLGAQGYELAILAACKHLTKKK
jgi:3-dehydroquinate dehydratase II